MIYEMMKGIVKEAKKEGRKEKNKNLGLGYGVLGKLWEKCNFGCMTRD
jgi:hypothetical protein